MERFLLYLDDLEDVIFAFALVGERIRRFVSVLAFLACAFLIQVSVVLLAVHSPPIGAGLGALLTVVVLYRSVTAVSGVGGTAKQYA